jgi:hypothetical protein
VTQSELKSLEDAIQDMLKEQLFKQFEVDECINFIRKKTYGRIRVEEGEHQVTVIFPESISLSTNDKPYKQAKKQKPNSTMQLRNWL